jgi:hypothetical protein
MQNDEEFEDKKISSNEDNCNSMATFGDNLLSNI